MAVLLSPIGNDAPFVDANGNPLTGGLLYTYVAGSTTPEPTFTTSAGSVQNANPIVLNSNGYPASGGSVVSIWLTQGTSYKFVLKTSAGVDIWSRDNIDGITPTSSADQWVAGPAPTYVSASQFTLAGDQTSTFHVGRRLKIVDAGGTKYATITVSAYTVLTTITVVVDSGGSLSSPLSTVSYGLISQANTSAPILKDSDFRVSGSADLTKKLALEVDNFTTATTRTLTFPDFSQWVAFNHQEMNCRLTLTSGTPVTTGDVTAAETIYLTPYNGNRIWLYNGSLWQPYVLTELSVDIPDATQMNDVFVYDNAGTLTLDVTAWTNVTTRATALVTQDGVYVKSGATGRRYVGSFYSTTAGNGQTNDSVLLRHVWNMYNRKLRPMSVVDTTNSWTYTLAAYQQANASTANQVSLVRGLDEDAVEAIVIASGNNSGGNAQSVGIGIDSSTVNSAQIRSYSQNTQVATMQAKYVGFPGIGLRELRWLEFSVAAGTSTWYGDNNGTGSPQSGLNATMLA